jgi:VWFA-related protein
MGMPFRRLIPCFGLCAALLHLCATVLFSQVQIGPDEVSLHAAPYSPLAAAGLIRTQVELVEVPVVVRDGKGISIPDLKREDFEVFDAGKKQEITAFSVEAFPRAGAATAGGPSGTTDPAAAPIQPETPRRFIALVLDDLNTDFGSLRRGKTAAEKFVSEGLSPGDLVGVFTTALSGTVLFTADVEKLRKTIEAVSPHPKYSDELHECPVIRAYEAYLIRNNLDPGLLSAKAGEMAACKGIDRLDLARRAVEILARGIWETAKANTENTLHSIESVVDTMGKMPGQRMVLLSSGGFVSGEDEQWLQGLATAALHSGVIINALDLRGLYTLIPGGDASTPRYARGMHPAEIRTQERVEDSKADGLAMLASGTGGQFFHNNNDLAAGLRRLGAIPEVLYVLGFGAGGVIHDGKYHALKVRLTGGRHGSVQARMGYNAPPKEPPAGFERERERDRVLMGSDSPTDLAVRVSAETSRSNADSKIAMRAWIDVSRLNFETKEERRTQKLTVIAGLLDRAGNFVTGRQAEAELAITDASFEALSSAGLTVALSLHAAPGTYNLRVLVQEALTGKMTAMSRPIEIR